MRHRRRLDGGVDDHFRKVGGLRRPGPHRHGQALLNERDKFLLAHSLALAAEREAVEGQPVQEELLGVNQRPTLTPVMFL